MKPMFLVGMNVLAHDGSVVVLDPTGKVLHWAEEERYRRLKKGEFLLSPDVFDRALEEASITRADIRTLAFANIHPLRERRLGAIRDNAPFHGYDRLHRAVERHIIPGLPNLQTVLHVRHHLCHAASAFYFSGYRESAILTVDAKGEDESAAIFKGGPDGIEPILSIPLPTSLGYLYTRIATWAGLRGADREGQLMALAATGGPEETKRFRDIFFESLKGNRWRASEPLYHRPCSRTGWDAYCTEVLGPPRAVTESISPYVRNVAFALQSVTEEILLNLSMEALELTECQHLCLSGGVFLNSVGNGRIARESGARKVYVPPWPGDIGLSMGAALAALSPVSNHSFCQGSPFLGTEITQADADDALRAMRMVPEPCVDVVEETASLLASGKIVGWAKGRMEVGPRALGARSILARTDRPDLAKRLNAEIKFRESWRPYGSAMLEEETDRLFGFRINSPYMSFVYPVSSETARKALSGVLHVDHTTRIQTVSPEFNPDFHRLLCMMRNRTGIGAVLNTSFNVKGEPIVRTATEAIMDFQETGLDALIVGGRLLRRLASSLPEAVQPVRPTTRPGSIPEEIRTLIHQKSMRLLWMNPTVKDAQTDELVTAGAHVTAHKLPVALLNSNISEGLQILNESAGDAQIIAIGISTYISYVKEHLPQLMRLLDRWNKDHLLLVDLDLNCCLYSSFAYHQSIVDLTELEYQWSHPRKEGGE